MFVYQSLRSLEYFRFSKNKLHNLMKLQISIKCFILKLTCSCLIADSMPSGALKLKINPVDGGKYPKFSR